MRRDKRVRRWWSTRTALARWLVIGALVLAFSGAGTAFAFFTALGNGGGSAQTGTMQTVTVSALAGGDVPSSTLYPGGSAADVILKVNNPNSFSVHLYSISGTGTISADAGHPGCTTTGVTFTPPSSPSITIPSGSSLVHVSGAASMDATSANGCQGATFSIPISITVHT